MYCICGNGNGYRNGNENGNGNGNKTSQQRENAWNMKKSTTIDISIGCEHCSSLISISLESQPIEKQSFVVFFITKTNPKVII